LDKEAIQHLDILKNALGLINEFDCNYTDPREELKKN